MARGRTKKAPPLAATPTSAAAQLGMVVSSASGDVLPALALGLRVSVLDRYSTLSKTLDYHGVIRTLRQLPPGLLVRSLAATALRYLALAGCDAVALCYIGARVPRSLLWIGTVAGLALGNAVGFGALTGGAVRYRVHGAAGDQPDPGGAFQRRERGNLRFSPIVLSGPVSPMLRPRSARRWACRR